MLPSNKRMRSRLPFYITVFFLTLSFSFGEFTASGPHLTSENYTQTIHTAGEDGLGFLVEFYAPWCGHCANFQSTFEELRRMNEFKVGQVDITNNANSEIVEKHNVVSFPTLLFYPPQTSKPYKSYMHTGEKSLEAITLFIERCSQEKIVELRTVEDVKEFFHPKGENGVDTVAIVGNVNLARSTFEDLANEMLLSGEELLKNKKVRFGIVDKYMLLQSFWKTLRNVNGIDGDSYYDVLEIDSSASNKKVKKAFRKLSKEKHPDRHALNNLTKSQAEAQFQRLSEAHHVLTDALLRIDYDQHMLTSSAEKTVDNVHFFFENIPLMFCPSCLQIYNSDEHLPNSPIIPMTSHSDEVNKLKKMIVLYGASTLTKYHQGMLGRLQEKSPVKKFVVVVEKEFKLPDTVLPILEEARAIDLESGSGGDVGYLWVDPIAEDNFLQRYNIDSKKETLPMYMLFDISGAYGSTVTKVIPPNSLQSGADLNNFTKSCLGNDGDKGCTASPRAGSEKALAKFNKKVKGVRTLVGKTFNSKIKRDLANKTDVVVMFVNQYDKGDKKVREEFQQFSARLHFEPSMSFYEMDVSLNDVPNLNVEIISTPTIYIFTANNRIVPFKGKEINTDLLIEWCKETVSQSFVSQLDETFYWGNKLGKGWRKFIFKVKKIFRKKKTDKLA